METLVALVIALGIIAIAWWAIGQMSLPPPVRIAAVVVIAIVAIVVLLKYAAPALGVKL